jgi:hypothetical protein
VANSQPGDLGQHFTVVLTECGDLPTRLIALHADDGTGHCAGCTWWDRPRPVYPCATRDLATRAVYLQATGLAGRVLPIRPDVRS